MPHRRLIVAAILFTTVLTGCLHWPGPTSTSRTLELFGGQEGYELIHLPALARVELYRLADTPTHPAHTSDATPHNLGRPLVIGGPATLSNTSLKRLSEILRNDATYDWSVPQSTSTTPARPTVALRFVGVKKTIDLLFSFTDNTLTVYEGDRPIGHARLGQHASELASLLALPKP